MVTAPAAPLPLGYEPPLLVGTARVEPTPDGAYLVVPPESLGSLLVSLAACAAGFFLLAVLLLILGLIRPVHLAGVLVQAALLAVLAAFTVALALATSTIVRGVVSRLRGTVGPRRVFLTHGPLDRPPGSDGGYIRRVAAVEPATGRACFWIARPVWRVRVRAAKPSGRRVTVDLLPGHSEAEVRRVVRELTAALGLRPAGLVGRT